MRENTTANIDLLIHEIRQISLLLQVELSTLIRGNLNRNRIVKQYVDYCKDLQTPQSKKGDNATGEFFFDYNMQMTLV